MYLFVILAFFAFPLTAMAEDFSLTDTRIFYGYGFYDAPFNEDTVNGAMATISLQHFGTWRYGENYFEADLFQGDFVGDNVASSGTAARIYAKWISRLSLGKMTGNQQGLSWGPFNDIFVAARVDRQGNGYYADMAGIGVGFVGPLFIRVGTDFFVRKDKFNHTTYQVSPYWYSFFQLGRPRFVFTGFLDLAGTDNLGADLTTQPELLWDIGEITVHKRDALLLGVAPFYHHNNSVNTLALQGEFRWIF